MIISKITLNNYRLYQGVNEIEFKVKNGKNIWNGRENLQVDRFMDANISR